MKGGQKNWAGPSPLSFGQNPKEQLLFFRETVPNSPFIHLKLFILFLNEALSSSFPKKCHCFGCLKWKVMLIYRYSCSKMKARCQYSQWTCAQGSFNMDLVGKPPKMETVQYIQLMTSMRFTLRGAVVTGDAYFGRFRKSWYIYRLQLLTVVLTHLKESLSTTLSMCVFRGWTTVLSILQAVALRLPRPLLHDGTIIGLLHTLTTACASRSMMSAQRGHG